MIDGNTGTVATVVAAPAGDLDSKAFYNCIFSPDGKIQRAGTPIDEFKVLSVRDGVLPGYKEVALKFTAVSPNSRLIDRRAVATATQIGDTAYVAIVSAAAVKWKDEQDRDGGGADVFRDMMACLSRHTILVCPMVCVLGLWTPSPSGVHGGTRRTSAPRAPSLIAHTCATGPSYSRPPRRRPCCRVLAVRRPDVLARIQGQRKLGRMSRVRRHEAHMASSTRSQGHSRSLSGTISTP